MKYAPEIKLILTDVVQPPTFGIDDETRLKAVKADLGDVGAVKRLFENEKIGLVYALQYVNP